MGSTVAQSLAFCNALICHQIRVTLDGESLTNWSASGHGNITIRTTVDDQHVLVRCGENGEDAG